MPQGRKDRGLIGLRKRRRWSADDARAVLKHLERSGLSVGEFAGRHGLEAQRLYRWRAGLGSATLAPAPAFVEIARTRMAPIEVVLRSGVVVRVPGGFDAEDLRRVVRAIDAAAEAC